MPKVYCGSHDVGRNNSGKSSPVNQKVKVTAECFVRGSSASDVILTVITSDSLLTCVLMDHN